jgi:MFS family permease
MLEKIRSIYNEYPKAFWVYNIIVFIDRFGGFMLYPFFALYLTKKFDIGMSTVGIVFAVFSISGFIGSALGGALTDRMGRKGVIIFSLILSSLSALGMGFAPTLGIFIAVSVIVGTLSSIGGPAHEAVVADLLPENKRAEGYGIIRVVFNLAVIIAPAVAGLLIARSYVLLFVVDAAISLLSASVVIFFLPETKPQAHPDAKPENMSQTFAGYGRVFKDFPFVAFVVMSVMTALIGYLISMNAVIVVLFQFWVARRLEKYKPMLMVALGTALYGLGFAMYGFTSTYFMFAIAMIVITIGEMVVSPFQQSFCA